MRTVITACTCIVILYMVDAIGYNGTYYRALNGMIIDAISHIR